MNEVEFNPVRSSGQGQVVSRSSNEHQLLDLLIRRSFARCRIFRSSGRTRRYHLDVRRTSVSAEGARLIGEVLFERVRPKAAYAVGGMAMGAIPLVAAAVVTSSLHGVPLEGFWVRPESKKHGTGRIVEGFLEEESRVVILEDVMGTGASVVAAIRSAQELSCKIVAVIALVDRLEGGRYHLWQNGFTNYESVYTIEDFGVKPIRKSKVNHASRSSSSL